MIKFVFTLVVCFGILTMSDGKAIGEDGRVRYDGYKVYRVHFNSEEQFQTLFELKNSAVPGVDVWALSRANKSADIGLSPEVADSFLTKIRNEEFIYELIIADLQKKIDEEREQNQAARRD